MIYNAITGRSDDLSRNAMPMPEPSVFARIESRRAGRLADYQRLRD
jgi:hypothetical protein